MREKLMAVLAARLGPGEYRFGIADLRGLLPLGYERYPSGISILRRLDPDAVDSAADGPSPAYYREYQEANAELGRAAADLAEEIGALGLGCLALPPTFSDAEIDAEFRRSLRTPVSHKMLATRSGLGWIGKTDLLVSTDFGPRVRLASILLSRFVEPAGEPIAESRCGSCDACVRACPARAASGAPWRAGVDRDEFFDPFRCRENCRMLARLRLGEDLSVCGICVSVCPRGKNALP